MIIVALALSITRRRRCTLPIIPLSQANLRTLSSECSLQQLCIGTLSSYQGDAYVVLQLGVQTPQETLLASSLGWHQVRCKLGQPIKLSRVLHYRGLSLHQAHELLCFGCLDSLIVVLLRKPCLELLPGHCSDISILCHHLPPDPSIIP